VRDTIEKIGLTTLGLTLVLSLVGTIVGDAVATAAQTEPAAPTTTAPAPPTTAAPASSTTVAPPTTEEPVPSTTAAPVTTEAPTTTVTPTPAGRRGPDPRWVDYGNCGRGYTACHVAKAYQRDGRFQWRQGRWFRWGDRMVRGHRDATWTAFRRQARAVNLYVMALAVARQRRQLVDRWSGVARCETGGNWGMASGNGYYGGLQFNLGTWQAYGGQGLPNQKPAWYQATIADRVRVRSGLHHWPHCGAHYG
jgi:hypothetical protein